MIWGAFHLSVNFFSIKKWVERESKERGASDPSRVGLGWGVPHLLARHGLTVASMLMMVTGVLLFALGLISDQVAQLRLERFE